MLKIEDLHKAKLVEVAWRFGQSYAGGYVAGQMIMSTLANRQRAGWGPWLDVINKIPAYMAENELPPLVFPSVWDGNFVKLLHVVEGIYEGAATDLSKGALYWGDLNRLERPWFKTNIVDPIKEDGPNAGQRVHQRVADINSLSFWR